MPQIGQCQRNRQPVSPAHDMTGFRSTRSVRYLGRLAETRHTDGGLRRCESARARWRRETRQRSATSSQRPARSHLFSRRSPLSTRRQLAHGGTTSGSRRSQSRNGAAYSSSHRSGAAKPSPGCQRRFGARRRRPGRLVIGHGRRGWPNPRYLSQRTRAPKLLPAWRGIRPRPMCTLRKHRTCAAGGHLGVYRLVSRKRSQRSARFIRHRRPPRPAQPLDVAADSAPLVCEFFGRIRVDVLNGVAWFGVSEVHRDLPEG